MEQLHAGCKPHAINMRMHAWLRQLAWGLSAGLGRGRGREGRNKHQMPSLLVFLWVGLGCGCSSPLGKHQSHHCLACDPLPARRGHLSRTLANRPPLAERSSYPRRRPALSHTAAPLPLAMAMARVTVTMLGGVVGEGGHGLQSVS